MKAVNLIPAGERRGSASSGSPIGSYILLAVLALVVAVSAAFTLSNKSISDKRAQLSDVQAQSQASAAQAEGLASYTTFAALRQKRTETVRSLAASRFDWSDALHEVARTIPSDAWLTSMRGSVSPAANVDGGTADPLRGSLPLPAIELIGCTTSQDKVAKVISSLRRIDGVERVTLSASEKAEGSGATNGAAAASGGGGDDCRHGSARFPQFSMTLFFKTPSAPATGAASGTTGTTP